MNAERFESKEYAEPKAIDFIRVCDLQVKQKFLMNGTWWEVRKIKEGRIYFYNNHATSRGKRESVGANNQQFVQIVKGY